MANGAAGRRLFGTDGVRGMAGEFLSAELALALARAATARIQQSARDGQLLASKDVVERLNHDDAATLGIDPEGLVYSMLGEMEGVTDKALRDAAGIPVTSLVAGDRAAR